MRSVRETITASRALLGRFRRLYQRLERVRRNQAVMAWSLALLEEEAATRTSTVGATTSELRSEYCTQSGTSGPEFRSWCARLGMEPKFDRWRWEKVYIARSLTAAGMLRERHRGLGFGVGGEPLVAYFAAQGCDIVATDLDATDARASDWVVDDDLPGAIDVLMRPDLCDPALFRERVELRAVDMNAIPSDLRDFDFCWSACSLEHLGSLAAGFDFIEASLECLRPGGVAVHTTEYNISSDTDTIESGPTVLYRRRDLEEFVTRLAARGHRVAPLDLDPRFGVLDNFISDMPHLAPPAIRLVVGGHVTTTVGLAITRAG